VATQGWRSTIENNCSGVLWARARENVTDRVILFTFHGYHYERRNAEPYYCAPERVTASDLVYSEVSLGTFSVLAYF